MGNPRQMDTADKPIALERLTADRDTLTVRPTATYDRRFASVFIMLAWKCRKPDALGARR